MLGQEEQECDDCNANDLSCKHHVMPFVVNIFNCFAFKPEELCIISLARGFCGNNMTPCNQDFIIMPVCCGASEGGAKSVYSDDFCTIGIAALIFLK